MDGTQKDIKIRFYFNDKLLGESKKQIADSEYDAILEDFSEERNVVLDNLISHDLLQKEFRHANGYLILGEDSECICDRTRCEREFQSNDFNIWWDDEVFIEDGVINIYIEACDSVYEKFGISLDNDDANPKIHADFNPKTNFLKFYCLADKDGERKEIGYAPTAYERDMIIDLIERAVVVEYGDTYEVIKKLLA